VKVEKLTLRNFRNIQDGSFYPDRRLNFLVGQNGQGKTSFIEALGYLATLRSFRGAKTEEVIHWGQDTAEISATLSASDETGMDPALDWRTDLKVVFTNGDRTSKVAFINGKPFRSSTQFLSQRFHSFELGFHTVIFNPSDHDLVRGEPSIRRSYIDRILAAEDVEYLKALQKYQRVLDQRNALLKSEPGPSKSLLAGFTEPLASYGSLLALKRLEWLSRLSSRLTPTAQRIAPNQPELHALYLSSWVPEIPELSINNKGLKPVHFTGQPHQASLELLEQAFWKRLSALEQVELEARSTLVGPHRDDWAFFLGPHVLKGHGSQGEVRSALLALKLSEIELFRERTGHRPLFLLDDFSSELDRERRSFLLRFLTDTDLQTVVTTTEDTLHVGKRFWVSNGALLAPETDHGHVPSKLI
jgi:DNA replication and repair protein RecF